MLALDKAPADLDQRQIGTPILKGLAMQDQMHRIAADLDSARYSPLRPGAKASITD